MIELDERAWRNGTLAWSPGAGRVLLPAHVAILGDDFMPAGWCGGCETCRNYPAPTVCLACSYGPDGHPYDRPTNWPCPVVCRHAALRKKVVETVGPCGACDAGLPQSCTCKDARQLVVELLREVERLAALVPWTVREGKRTPEQVAVARQTAVDSRHTYG